MQMSMQVYKLILNCTFQKILSRVVKTTFQKVVKGAHFENIYVTEKRGNL